jgi:branched-chain amino acid transport system substrate-binding protein
MNLFRTFAIATVSLAALAVPAFAEDTVKVGLIMPFTGPFASEGKEIGAAVKL